MLSFQIERLRRVRRFDAIVVATTTDLTDDPIADFCAAEEVACTRGSEQDVLARYYEAAEAFKAQTVIRVTADCPLIDPQVVDRVVQVAPDDLAERPGLALSVGPRESRIWPASTNICRSGGAA